MKKVEATKRIMSSGSSLFVNITKEVKALKLERGEFVKVILIRDDKNGKE